MTMPEAAVHETDSSKPTKDEVRRPRKFPIMKAVPETARMQRAAEHHLRFRVFAAYSCHHSRPNGSINYVDHGLSRVASEERYRVRISQNIFNVIKEDAVFVRSVAHSKPDPPKHRKGIVIRASLSSCSVPLRFRISHHAVLGAPMAIPANSLQRTGLQPPYND